MDQILMETKVDNNQTRQQAKTVKAIGQHMKILVIDDNEQTTTMLSKFFNAKGFEITTANDPIEGLHLIRQEKFGVILLDVMMPVIGGIGIIEILAGEDTLKDQNVFIFTGANLPEVQVKNLLRRDGVNGIVKKPFELDNLLTTILG